MNALKGNLWRRLVLPTRIGSCSLTSLRQRLVKTGGRLVKHARYYWLLLAESHLTRRVVGGMGGRIGNCSLTSLRQRLVKTGGRLVKHARYYWLLLAESHLARRLFGGMVWRID